MFCNQCGTRLAPSAASAPVGGAAPSPAAATAERRLVSVLFADLVGFTTLAEGRDPEETRELLSRYFELAREIVERYAGTIEKFIGDAVMAVWGAPSAQEDDAERAVRAALDLVGAVGRLGPGIAARAGVLTGEAAVTLGARGQGMVAGDPVNTASRLQAAAAPGTVLVGEATMRAASGAIAFEAAGDQALKGKSVPVPAWRALRVVAERGGRNRAETLEAPFVGRDEELHLLKELFHATAREGRARLVSVMGPAGIGKSRLAWEFNKYVDGVAEPVWWHVGRSPAYGEGASFRALGEMVRRRCGLGETDDEATVRAAVASTVREHVADEAERRWVEGALLTLLGVGATATAPTELFGAWRAFFERLADSGTVALVFEDFNNADPGLIDFVDHLLEWSRARPIYVLTLARPDLLERRPDWHAKRNLTAVTLEPLPDAAMRELLAGLAPGLPEPAADAIVTRADGIPLYAVETVRMLLAEGRLALRDGRYVPTGDLADLAVPETLTALIASRLDGLPPDERALVHDAAVLGQGFSITALAAVSGIPDDGLAPRLRSLVRKEILTAAGSRSAERDEYLFVQGLIREVAYHTLARADRKARHLAAARYYESLGSDELAGAVASHYLAARRDAAEGSEASDLVAHARVALGSAAARATSLGSHEQAAAFFEQALEIAEEPPERALLLERAGEAWRRVGRWDRAIARLREAVEVRRSLGTGPEVAGAVGKLGEALSAAMRHDEAAAVLGPAVEVFADLTDEPEGVALFTTAARAASSAEDYARALALVETALPAAERLDLPELVATGLAAKGGALRALGRGYEGLADARAAVELADAHASGEEALRLRGNLLLALYDVDVAAAVRDGRAALLEARRLGLRGQAITLAGNASEAARWTGEWDWALSELDALLDGDLDLIDRAWLEVNAAILRAWRGEDVADRVAALDVATRGSQEGTWYESLRCDLDSCLGLAHGGLPEAHERARDYARLSSLNAPPAFALGARAALWKGDHGGAAEDLRALEQTGVHGLLVSLRRTAIRAGIAALQGRTPEARALYVEAQRGLLDRGVAFEAALVGIDMARLLGRDDPEASRAAAEARPILERLGARPFIARLDAALDTPGRTGLPFA